MNIIMTSETGEGIEAYLTIDADFIEECSTVKIYITKELITDRNSGEAMFKGKQSKHFIRIPYGEGYDTLILFKGDTDKMFNVEIFNSETNDSYYTIDRR